MGSHETRLEEYSVQFTYCCCEMHFFDGNRFASHQRCQPFEPTEKMSELARLRERDAHAGYIKDQEAREAKRLQAYSVPKKKGLTVHRLDVETSSKYNHRRVGPGGLDDFVFHIVEEPQSTDDLIDSLIMEPDETKRSSFFKMNPHVKKGYVEPAQMVVLSDPKKSDYLTQSLGLVRQLENVEGLRQTIEGSSSTFAKNFVDHATLGNFSDGLGFATNYFRTHVKEVFKVLDEIEEGYSSKFRLPGGTLRTESFAEYRYRKYNELDSLLNKAMKTSLYGGIVGPKNALNLDAMRYSTEFDWTIRKAKVMPTLDQFYGNVVKFDTALKAAGYLAIGLQAIDTHSKVQDACTVNVENCKKAEYVFWGGFAGELIGGISVGASTTAIMSMVVGALALGGVTAVGLVAVPTIALGYLASKGAGAYTKVFAENLYKQRELGENVDFITHMNRDVRDVMKSSKAIEIELLGDYGIIK